jgi:hypothetical protein
MVEAEINVSILNSIVAEGGGSIRIHLVTERVMPFLAFCATAGDTEANAVHTATEHALKTIMDAPPGLTALCSFCKGALPRPANGNLPFTVCVIVGQCDAPRQSASFVGCADCAATKGGIKEAMNLLLSKIWPKTKSITMQGHAPGHA